MRPVMKRKLKTRVKLSTLADMSACHPVYLSRIINNKETPSDELAVRLAESANTLYREEVFIPSDFTCEDEVFDQAINELCHHIAKELDTTFMLVYKVLLCLEQAKAEQWQEIIKLIKAKNLIDEV